MSSELAHDISRHLPYLRRYARALTGDQRIGDSLVAASLKQLLSKPTQLGREAVRVTLYRSLAAICARAANLSSRAPEGAAENEGIVAQAVSRLPGVRRQLLLLSTLEGFSATQIATIMQLPEDDVRHELAAGKQELREQPPTSILIIEDEPVIALDISHTVSESGHRVTGIATTHREAVELARADPPGLVLADIQLSDDSSGIEAVREILEHYRLPVVFITAFPDRLLTGERPEPAFLITKPFEPETLAVAISQALASHRI